MDRLQPLDAVFVDAEDEDENTSMAIASIAVFQGTAPAREEVMALIADRLPAVPRYRQKLRTVPLRLGRPVWVDDPDFDLGYHVRHVTLAEPGEYRQLADQMADVMSQRLDRDHPLWEYWVVEGLARDRWALISKVHHCMIDGVGGADLYRVIMAAPAEAACPAENPPAAEQPSAITLAAQAVGDMLQMPLRSARAEYRRGRPGRRRQAGSRGEEPQEHEVPSLVPVSVRAPGDHGGFGNEVSATITDLPVHIADPVERLAAVRAIQDSLKADHEAMIGQALVTLGRHSAYPLTSWLVRKGFAAPQREIVTVTTNVPGPREPLYWMGRRLEEIIPYVPIASTVRTGISIFSYDGEITFGITADYDANPDLEVLARGIEHGVSELLLAATQHAMAAAG
jgi:diacylglycerol O-acyltransferase / wax synthase